MFHFGFYLINERFPNTPRIIHFILIKFIPKPDLIFVIKTNTPEKNIRRKGELSLEMFNFEMKSYLNNMPKFAEINVINNIESQEEISSKKVWNEVLNKFNMRNY